jgi:glycosyltransferase involved in cell wall biosynthesis
MLDEITPVIITFNEALNIGRTLGKLSWAQEVVVVDSHSTDDTLQIAAGFPNVRIVLHPFVSLADQWNFAVHDTGIKTEWVLRLDADYVLTDELIEELARLKPEHAIGGYRVNFGFSVHGVPLRTSIYPPDYKLFRRTLLSFYQDGHTEKPRFSGARATLKGRIIHDDRKTISRWLWSQDRYMLGELKKLSETPDAQLDRVDRLRKQGVFAPVLIFLYMLFWKRLILDGRAGLYYVFQRTAAEIILALNLLDAELRREALAAESHDGRADPSLRKPSSGGATPVVRRSDIG